ncbi:MAG: hypothetical protein ABL984_03630 [Pyrinomonadaceae bacterium]
MRFVVFAVLSFAVLFGPLTLFVSSSLLAGIVKFAYVVTIGHLAANGHHWLIELNSSGKVASD